MSAKRKTTSIMQHHKDNITVPESAEILEDHYSKHQNGNAESTEHNSNAVVGTGTSVAIGNTSIAAVGSTNNEMASLWASYNIGLKKTPSPGSSIHSKEREQDKDKNRDRECSPVGEASNVHDETGSSGNKEDEDDDDEDFDEKLDPRQHDPERLKAFNMFVRLFVDENLDRIIPISKQPKEKIQAIIDSCTRQFPEFAERARKRIRTYLKSCRRNKRGREGAPWEIARPTPAHLTSVQAEQVLATACENESDNAKRMRIGLEPVSQPMPTLPAATQTDVRANMEQHFGGSSSSAIGSGVSSGTPIKSLLMSGVRVKCEDTPLAAVTLSSLHQAPLACLQANLQQSTSTTPSASVNFVSTESPLPLTSSAKLLTSNTCSGINNDTKATISQTTIVSASTANGIGNVEGAAPTAMYRPNFGHAFQRSGGSSAVSPTLPAGLYSPQSFSSGILSNGPTDLSMKNTTKPLLSHKLNATEVTAVRQLITGYRESAAFLLRSADELEQLLHQQS